MGVRGAVKPVYSPPVAVPANAAVAVPLRVKVVVVAFEVTLAIVHVPSTVELNPLSTVMPAMVMDSPFDRLAFLGTVTMTGVVPLPAIEVMTPGGVVEKEVAESVVPRVAAVLNRKPTVLSAWSRRMM